MRNKKIFGPASRLIIKGEGRDEWGNRYFKLAVKGSELDLPPFSMHQISSDPDALYKALSNAGLNIFTRKAKNAVLELLQAQQHTPSTFKVATRLGWNSGAIVRPDDIVGPPRSHLETAFGDLPPQMLAKYRSNGTLEDWKGNVASLVIRGSSLPSASRSPGRFFGLSRGQEAEVSSFGVRKRPAKPRQPWWPVRSGVVIPAQATGKSGLPRPGTPRLTKWKLRPWLTTTAFSSLMKPP